MNYENEKMLNISKQKVRNIILISNEVIKLGDSITEEVEALSHFAIWKQFDDLITFCDFDIDKAVYQARNLAGLKENELVLEKRVLLVSADTLMS